MLGILASIFAPAVLKSAVGGLIDKGTDLFKAYINKEITRAELEAKLGQAMLEVFGEIEKAHADSITKTFASFMDAIKTSPFMQRVWGVVVLSQLAVLVWHQVGIPALVYLTGQGYPSSGSTVEWAYALIAACVGFGASLLRVGPVAGGGLVDKIKSLVKVK